MFKGKNFQVILLVVFGFAFAFAAAVFAGLIPAPDRSKGAETQAKGEFTLWGTFDDVQINDVLKILNSDTAIPFTIKYFQIDEMAYDNVLLEALASGNSPDLFIMPDHMINDFKNKLIQIPYETFSVRTFVDGYAQAADIFRDSDGVLGVPLLVDPLIMYFNRDLIESESYVEPPKYWNEEFIKFVEDLTSTDEIQTVNKSAVAMGEVENILHSTEILSALIMQLENNIVQYGKYGSPDIKLKSSSAVTSAPAISSVDFYTRFSNPASNVYTWSKTLPSDQDAFIGDQLAVYFGLASELYEIRRRNPNLNFDIRTIPQVEQIDSSITYGLVYGLVIPKQAKNINESIQVANTLASGDVTQALANAMGVVPVRRDLLSNKKGFYTKTLNKAALQARSWFKPSQQEADSAFDSMINSVLSGARTSQKAVSQAAIQLERGM